MTDRAQMEWDMQNDKELEEAMRKRSTADKGAVVRLSLWPVDVGSDLKLSQQDLVLPRVARLYLKWIDARGLERSETFSYAQARFVLKRAGYKLADGRRRKKTEG